MQNIVETLKLRVQVGHHVPGRLRLRLEDSNANPDRLTAIRHGFEILPGVQEATVNGLTGSVRILYDPEQYAEFRAALLEVLQVDHLAELDERARPEPSALDRELERGARRFDVLAKKFTLNLIGLKEAFPLAFVVGAALVAESPVGAPLWLTLALFGFSSYVALHPPEPEPPRTELLEEIDAQLKEVRQMVESGTARRAHVMENVQ